MNDPLKDTACFRATVIAHLEKVQEHHTTLYGKNGNPGLDKKVDRLEQSQKLTKTIGMGVLGLVLETIWRYVTGRHQ